MARTRRRSEANECAYCGAESPETRDHVPPASLFPAPRASTLVTVPCCESCRVGWSDDDEYFRAAVVNDFRVFESKAAKPAIAKLLRSMGKPKKRGFARSILDSISEIEVVTPAGLYLGRTDALELDAARISRVLARIVSGLFFHEHRRRVPAGYEVGGRLLHPGGLAPVAELLHGVSFAPIRVAQDGVFDYVCRGSDEDPNASLLFGRLYENLYFMGWTRPRPPARHSPLVTK